MYAERKGWTLEDVEVQLSHERVYAKDCEECEARNVLLDEVRSQIRLVGDLDESQRKRLLQIARRCPVHRTLSSEVNVRSELI